LELPPPIRSPPPARPRDVHSIVAVDGRRRAKIVFTADRRRLNSLCDAIEENVFYLMDFSIRTIFLVQNQRLSTTNWFLSPARFFEATAQQQRVNQPSNTSTPHTLFSFRFGQLMIGS
jgi:hypothetical protein